MRQMMRKIRIEDAGDTSMLPGEYIDVGDYNEQNAIAVAEGKEPAKGRPKDGQSCWASPRLPWQPIRSCQLLPSRRRPVS